MPQNTIGYDHFSPAEGTSIRINSYPGRITTRSLPSTIVIPKKTARTIGPTECWDGFVRSQPEWIRMFLQEIHFYTDDGFANLDEILTVHDKEGYLLSVSDGSVKFHNMSFGWIIASPDGQRLAAGAGAGPCQGRGNSLRSEGAGMLSATLFLALISHHMEHQLKVEFLSDNRELIRRMKDHQHYDDPYPNATLASEYDIIEEIYNTCKIYKITGSYQWVKGHQDRHTEYESLPLNAQLNVEADYYAGQYQDNFGKLRPLCTLLPTSGAMLSIRTISVTSDYRNQLIRAYTEPRYIEYVQNRFGWSDDVIHSIAWKCLTLAARRINRSVLMTKVCNDLLPTAVTLQQQKYQYSDRCNMCDGVETRDHMIQCKAESRAAWRVRFMTALRRKMKALSTKFEVEETLGTALCDWMEHGRVEISKFPPKFEAALKSQETIGWRHVFAGKLSQQWLRLQGDVHLEDGKIRTDYLWGASIVEVILTKFMELWELRNEEVHGKTEEVQEQRRKFRLSGKVRELDKLKQDARPADMGLFHENVEIYIEEANAIALANYISSHTKAIKNSVKKWTSRSQHGVRSIVDWIRGLNETNDAALDKIHTIQRDKLLKDGRHKTRRRTTSELLENRRKNGPRQIPLDRYLSLMNRFD